MKHGKKPNRSQRKLMEKWGINPGVWMVVKDTPGEMHLVHRFSDSTTRIVTKEDKRWEEREMSAENGAMKF